MVGDSASVAAVACLNEPLRRRLYEYVVSSPEPVSREGAAGALGVTRPLAAFHLDKLVDAGLLKVEQWRPEGRSGPGAGRPAKWYSRASTELTVSVPERNYELAARLLAEAAERSGPSLPMADALAGAARLHGQALGTELREERGSSPLAQEDLISALDSLGYEPRREDDAVVMANCPFHVLAVDHPRLVCDMNLHFLQGLTGAVGLDPQAARLDPAPGRCCVTVGLARPKSAGGKSARRSRV